MIMSEMIHEARIVPLDGRPHANAGIGQWLGDSRGRWEGKTLVVDTTNFREAVGLRRMPAPAACAVSRTRNRCTWSNA